jgi:hypothetical protein
VAWPGPCPPAHARGHSGSTSSSDAGKHSSRLHTSHNRHLQGTKHINLNLVQLGPGCVVHSHKHTMTFARNDNKTRPCTCTADLSSCCCCCLPGHTAWITEIKHTASTVAPRGPDSLCIGHGVECTAHQCTAQRTVQPVSITHLYSSHSQAASGRYTLQIQTVPLDSKSQAVSSPGRGGGGGDDVRLVRWQWHHGKELSMQRSNAVKTALFLPYARIPALYAPPSRQDPLPLMPPHQYNAT